MVILSLVVGVLYITAGASRLEMITNSDLSVLSRSLSQHTGRQQYSAQVKSYIGSGGSGMQTGILHDSSGASADEFFFKSSTSLRGYDALLGEFRGIEEIYKTKTIRVPRPVALLQNDFNSFAIFEKIKFNGITDGRQLGRQLAAMHKISSEKYGFHTNNTIGATFQPNPYSQVWADFFVEHRLRHMLNLCKLGGVDFGTGRGEELCDRVHTALREHEETSGLRPSLVHGDLWSGNYGWTESGPVVFDCSCYYGDREVDLAMMTLFGSPPSHFHEEYEREMPVQLGDREGVEGRRTIYNLYHMLNHAVLFSGGYVRSSALMIDRIISSLR